MAIEAAFETLQLHLDRLREEFAELRVNAEEFYPLSRAAKPQNGHPLPEAPSPVTTLADHAADLEGEAEGAFQAGLRAAQLVRYPRNLLEAQVAIGLLQRSLLKIMRQFLADVATYDGLNTLQEMGVELGEGWPKWTELIHSIIKDCRERLLESFSALAECWQELAEKLTANSVSLQTTNIGQQITKCDPASVREL